MIIFSFSGLKTFQKGQIKLVDVYPFPGRKFDQEYTIKSELLDFSTISITRKENSPKNYLKIRFRPNPFFLFFRNNDSKILRYFRRL